MQKWEKKSRGFRLDPPHPPSWLDVRCFAWPPPPPEEPRGLCTAPRSVVYRKHCPWKYSPWQPHDATRQNSHPSMGQVRVGEREVSRTDRPRRDALPIAAVNPFVLLPHFSCITSPARTLPRHFFTILTTFPRHSPFPMMGVKPLCLWTLT